jgi:hypothetical protein
MGMKLLRPPARGLFHGQEPPRAPAVQASRGQAPGGEIPTLMHDHRAEQQRDDGTEEECPDESHDGMFSQWSHAESMQYHEHILLQ